MYQLLCALGRAGPVARLEHLRRLSRKFYAVMRLLLGRFYVTQVTVPHLCEGGQSFEWLWTMLDEFLVHSDIGLQIYCSGDVGYPLPFGREEQFGVSSSL